MLKLFDWFKRKLHQRNAHCNSLIGRLEYVLSMEDTLFPSVHMEVDAQALAKWKFIARDVMATVEATKPLALLGAKGCRTLQQHFIELKNHSRTLPERVAHHNQRAKDNQMCNQITPQLGAAKARYSAIFQISTEFVDPEQGHSWVAEVTALRAQWTSIPETRRKETHSYELISQELNTLADLQKNIQHRIHQHNEAVATKRAEAAYALIGDVEGRKLDSQQLNCIVKKAHNHLVIAGAGTGKTTTVIGKIKYLLLSKQARPEDILVLSFTNASAAEMSERIQRETKAKIAASTFHKLGLNIISQVNGIMPKITHIDLHKFVRERLEIHMRSEQYLKKLGECLIYSKASHKSEHDFDSKTAYDEYLTTNPPVTLNGEKIKSYGELDIANFLESNGILYLYEQEYVQDTRTNEYAQYYPDFYLPEYNIYIEYFGINRNGEVPAFFSSQNGVSAAKAYHDSMQWKRKLHKENGTTMIECFAYEKLEGTLEENLARQLEANGVILHPKTAQEIWSHISNENGNILDGVIELFGTIINLIKSNHYSIDNVRSTNTQNVNRRYIFDILWLVEPIMHAYDQQLKANDEIDFNDMINIATDYIVTKKYHSPYKYVIVDEYQDISKARFHLLQALRESCDYDLFCVGDDWQSIYRFAGSDIGFILNFSRYWGAAEESKIETTYRFTKSLIDISGKFIMQNPAQKRKAIHGNRDDQNFALSEVMGYTEKYAVAFMAEKLDDLPNGSTLFFIGRYSFDIEILKSSGLFGLKYNNQTGFVDVQYSKRIDLKMSFTTAHKSKGLQADYVVIINNKNSRMGFPSMIQDSPVLDLLLEKTDCFPHAEERRLFYVALTRAKKKAILMTVKDKESVFVKELRERYKDELKKERLTCPRCGGRLLVKEGKFGKFVGCSNYKMLNCRYTKNAIGKTSDNIQ